MLNSIGCRSLHRSAEETSAAIENLGRHARMSVLLVASNVPARTAAASATSRGAVPSRAGAVAPLGKRGPTALPPPLQTSPLHRAFVAIPLRVEYACETTAAAVQATAVDTQAACVRMTFEVGVL